jgi:hypothetical protein
MVQFCEACKNNNKTKKISGLFSFSCKCEYKILCQQCRYPENHNCKYDYRKEGVIELEKKNPKILGDKLEKI